MSKRQFQDGHVTYLLRKAHEVGALIPPEMYDFIDIVVKGAEKHGSNNWLTASCTKSPKQFHDSMFHHLAESFSGQKHDKESGQHPLLHLACGALMLYVRQIKGLEK